MTDIDQKKVVAELETRAREQRWAGETEGLRKLIGLLSKDALLMLAEHDQSKVIAAGKPNHPCFPPTILSNLKECTSVAFPECKWGWQANNMVVRRTTPGALPHRAPSPRRTAESMHTMCGRGPEHGALPRRAHSPRWHC